MPRNNHHMPNTLLVFLDKRMAHVRKMCLHMIVVATLCCVRPDPIKYTADTFEFTMLMIKKNSVLILLQCLLAIVLCCGAEPDPQPLLRGSINKELSPGNSTDRNAYACHHVTFRTSKEVYYADSPGPFYVRGLVAPGYDPSKPNEYVRLPKQCHSDRGDSCSFAVCYRTLDIWAGTSNAWYFVPEQNCGRGLKKLEMKTGYQVCRDCDP